MIFLNTPLVKSINFGGTTSGVVNLTVAAAAGTHTIKLPTSDGSANQILKTDGSGQWGWVTPTGQWTFSSQTGDFTASTTNFVYYKWDVSAGSSTMGLPAVSGNSGLMIGVELVATSGGRTGTVDANSSESLDDKLSIVLSTVHDRLILLCDGVRWLIFARHLQSDIDYNSVCSYRISTESGVPVSASNRTSQGTIYLVACGKGYHLLVPNVEQTGFDVHAPTNSSLTWTVSGSNGDIKDLYVWNNAGTLTTVLSPAWSSSTSRGAGAGTAAQSVLNGITVNAVAIGSMPAFGGTYIGSIVLTGTNITEDSESKRYVVNAYNKEPRHLKSTDSSVRGPTTSTSNTQVGSVQIAFLSDGKQSVRVLGKSCCYVNGLGYGILAIGTGTTTQAANSTQDFFGSGNVALVFASAAPTLEEVPALGLTTYYLLYRSFSGAQTYADGQAYNNGATTGGKPGTSLESLILC